MNGPSPDPIDELLDREASALRDMTIPPGPSEAVVARTLTALATESRSPTPHPFWRNPTMFTILKMAAALLVAAGGLTFLARPHRASAESFAEVAAKLRDAQTLSYRMTVLAPGQDKPMNSRLFYKDPGWVRTESDPSGEYAAVMDTIHGKSLITNFRDKTAIVLDSPPLNDGKTPDVAAGMIQGLRELADKQGEQAGEKRIASILARGYRVHADGLDQTVWIDPEAKLPLLIEMNGKIGGISFQGTLSDIQLDPKLDDALFALEPPAGYTVQKAATKIATPLDGVVKMLRIYAEATEGAFPERLDDLPAFQKAIETWAKANEGTITQADSIEIAQAMAMTAVMVQVQKDHFVYQPQGVKLGDAKAFVFGYKPPGSETWKAVYGDLHVADVAADQIPGKSAK